MMLKVLNNNIKSLLNTIKLWFVSKAMNKEIENSFSSTGVNNVVSGGMLGLEGFSVTDEQLQIVQDQKQYKYAQGMMNLKEAINKQMLGQKSESVMGSFKGEKDFYLGKDLLSLAKIKELPKESQLRKIRTSIIAGTKADIKNDVDKYRMINRRIKEMYSVQKSKLERKLLRSIRVAEKEGNTVLAKKLTKEFYEKYARKN